MKPLLVIVFLSGAIIVAFLAATAALGPPESSLASNGYQARP